MDYKEIQNLIKLINNSNLSEFKMKDGDFRLTIRTKEYQKFMNAPAQASSPVMVSSVAPPIMETPQAPAANIPSQEQSNAAKGDTQEVKKDLIEIKSPIVGTFYRAPGPDKDVYVKIGDQVTPDTVVCIVEAMKLFNEIEAEVNGKIVEILVEDATPIEYDQPLFLVDPKG